MLFDISTITTEEQIDRYSRGLKSYIWKELSTKEYISLSELMKDAERVEMAHGRLNRTTSKFENVPKQAQNEPSEPVPMEIGNFQLKKLTAAERDQCRKEGRCFRCREKAIWPTNAHKAGGIQPFNGSSYSSQNHRTIDSTVTNP